MSREDIIRMAREAYGDWYPNAVPPELERFAALVAAHEREACAKVCEDIANKPSNVVLGVAINCANALRARGEVPR